MNDLNGINSVILCSGNSLEKYLEIYGKDNFNTQETLVLMSCIRDLIDEACWFELNKECTDKLYFVLNQVAINNPQIKFISPFNRTYVNINSKQTPYTY